MTVNTPLPQARLRQCAGGFTADRREHVSLEEATLAPVTGAASRARARTVGIPPFMLELLNHEVIPRRIRCASCQSFSWSITATNIETFCHRSPRLFQIPNSEFQIPN